MTAPSLDPVTIPLVVDCPTHKPWETPNAGVEFDAFLETSVALTQFFGMTPTRVPNAPELFAAVLRHAGFLLACTVDGTLHARHTPTLTWTEPSWRQDPDQARGALLAFVPALLLRAEAAPCAHCGEAVVRVRGFVCEPCYKDA